MTLRLFAACTFSQPGDRFLRCCVSA